MGILPRRKKTRNICVGRFMCLVSYSPPSWLPKETSQYMDWRFMCLVSYGCRRKQDQYNYGLGVHVFGFILPALMVAEGHKPICVSNYVLCSCVCMVSYSWPPGFILLTSWFHTLDLLVSYSWPPGFVSIASDLFPVHRSTVLLECFARNHYGSQ